MIPYEFTSYADKQFRKFPSSVQRQIIKKVEYFLKSPDPFYFAEPLAGRKGKAYRFRITDYRVIFETSNGNILITDVGKRDNIY